VRTALRCRGTVCRDGLTGGHWRFRGACRPRPAHPRWV